MQSEQSKKVWPVLADPSAPIIREFKKPLRRRRRQRRLKIREVKFDVYGKRQTFAVCLQLSVQ